MKQNEDTFEISDPSSKKSAIKRVVDIPGHQRVRYMLRDYLPGASAIVFLVDSVNFEVRPVAEYLYDLFTNKIIRKKKMPILIACNKKDIITAKVRYFYHL
jgi:signal recognition particle receptor subunit beta